MALATGTRFGPYEVTGLLGAGGMGEVYRARDTRLGRSVAIKVLPPEVAADLERKRRFEQEARAVSALNHPHICALYDIGSASLPGTASFDYLVMEFLEGQSLADRLAKGPLPLREALEFAAQIADAQMWKELGGQLDRAGLSISIRVAFSADGESYAYNYSRKLSTLYIVEGLK